MHYSYPESIVKTHFFDFELAERTRVCIMVYDMMGRIVTEVVDSELSAGEHVVAWQSVNNQGDPLPEGIYFYTMETKEFKATKAMTIVN